VPTWHKKRFCRGFTIVELTIAIGIVATLAAIAVPVFSNHVDKARNARAVVEIRGLEKLITIYDDDNLTPPDSLGDVGQGGLLDPWGNPYQYMRITGAMGEKPRKDRFLVPVNSDFDLYSMGKDGDSKAPFTAMASRDDIVRANDGGYVGLASGF
jgi:general secretion pathway protein G